MEAVSAIAGIGTAANKLTVTKIADRNIMVTEFTFAHSNSAALISFRATARFHTRQLGSTIFSLQPPVPTPRP